MKNFLTKLKKSYILTAVFYVIVGICLTIWPETMGRLVCYAFGGLLLIYGLIIVIGNFADHGDGSFYGFGMINGLIAAGIGIFFIVKYSIVAESIGFVMGLIIVIDSSVKFQKALELHRNHYPLWWIALLLSFMTIGLGVLVIADPFEATLDIARLVGICLMLVGISDIWTISRVSKYVKAVAEDLIITDQEFDHRA